MLGDLNPCSPVRSAALAASYVASETACVVRRTTVTNTSGGTLYLHVFDAIALPADTAVPLTSPITVAAGTNNGNDWRPEGVKFTNGCVLALSSTLDTLTIVGSSVGRFFVEKVQ